MSVQPVDTKSGRKACLASIMCATPISKGPDTIETLSELFCVFRGGEREPVFAGRALGQPIAVTEHVWVQLLKLNRVGTDAFHPIPASNVLSNKSGPDGCRVHRASACSSLETHTARIFVKVDTERMEISVVRDLTADSQHCSK
jgi:hypothetical protein